jgi:predicted P-loop ATPase/GTPase
MVVIPRLADISCQRMVFQPGDRVLVRTYHNLSAATIKNLRRSIIKWAGCEVEVLVYNGNDMEISIEQI